jgi:hypothetical protein
MQVEKKIDHGKLTNRTQDVFIYIYVRTAQKALHVNGRASKPFSAGRPVRQYPLCSGDLYVAVPFYGTFPSLM